LPFWLIQKSIKFIGKKEKSGVRGDRVFDRQYLVKPHRYEGQGFFRGSVGESEVEAPLVGDAGKPETRLRRWTGTAMPRAKDRAASSDTISYPFLTSWLVEIKLLSQ
jgi:hypothetical protein